MVLSNKSHKLPVNQRKGKRWRDVWQKVDVSLQTSSFRLMVVFVSLCWILWLWTNDSFLSHPDGFLVKENRKGNFRLLWTLILQMFLSPLSLIFNGHSIFNVHHIRVELLKHPVLMNMSKSLFRWYHPFYHNHIPRLSTACCKSVMSKVKNVEFQNSFFL